MRVIQDQRNMWGTSGTDLNAQRADLWVINLDNVTSGLNQQLNDMNATSPVGGWSIGQSLASVPYIPAYYAQAVELPELRINAEPYRRDSRPYMMPGQDEPLGTIGIKFLMDSPTSVQRSKIYRLLDVWRMFVRAGRGSFSSEPSVVLNKDYRIDFAFDISLRLLRGDLLNKVADFGNEDSYNGMQDALGDLQVCGEYTLKNAWLASFKVSTLAYPSGNQLAVIDAQLYAETIVDANAVIKSA